MVFCYGRYRLAVADMAVADMVCGRYGRTPSGTPNPGSHSRTRGPGALKPGSSGLSLI